MEDRPTGVVAHVALETRRTLPLLRDNVHYVASTLLEEYLPGIS
ncbi:hypothetical protein E2C01_076065 [Portunus trituberculatus]|uniref:Uncharacterized protein n=1 Tax=Portunus trituberculatus TaxID=210409 RepID=A0A5B7IHZ0_PORTR|nr:hypothetical protein [Portunus trituberculatus]